METLSPGPKSLGRQLRMSEPCATAVSPATPLAARAIPTLRCYGQARCHSNVRGAQRAPEAIAGRAGGLLQACLRKRSPLRAMAWHERSRNQREGQGVGSLTRNFGSLTRGTSAATSLLRAHGPVYVNGRLVYVNDGHVWRRDGAERSRNLTDAQGPAKICWHGGDS